MLVRVLVSLCLLVATGCLTNNIEACEAIRNCTTALEDFDISRGVPLANVARTGSASETLDEICGAIEYAETCFAEAQETCPDDMHRGLARSILTIGEYVCDENNRNDMEEILQSDCVTNETVQAQYNSELEGCLLTFVTEIRDAAKDEYGNQRRVSNFCPFFDRLGSCMVRVSTAECGQLTGQFTRRVWNIMTQNMMPAQFRGCFTAVQTTRRALEYLMPTVAKRHFTRWDGLWDELNWNSGLRG